MTKKVLIRTDADNTTGMGHFFRSLSLARHMAEQNIEVHFVLKQVAQTPLDLLKQYGFSRTSLNKELSYKDEAMLLAQKWGGKYDTLVFDIAHYQTMAAVAELCEYTKILNYSFATTMLIDGFNDTAIIDKINPCVDFVVTPYLGAKEKNIYNKKYKHLVGPEFFIFAPEYNHQQWERTIPNEATNLLITMGGSDPFELTLLTLDAFSVLKKYMACRIIIGPGFSRSLKEKILIFCANNNSSKAIISPPNLVEHLLWADMAISASGLTKYETAFAGVPSLQIPFNKDIAKITKDFEEEGHYIALDLSTKLTKSILAEAIENLAKNKNQRAALVKGGQSLFPQNGAKALISQLILK